MHKAQRLINHVALVLDGSSSMSNHKSKLVSVADEQIKYLALRSEELSQETRVSVYLFADDVECLIFDMDVMRLPSIADLYKASGMTALVDSVIKSQDDLATTSRIYGDHAFLTFVLTDGMENASRNSWTQLGGYVNRSDGWNVAFLVPDKQGVAYMNRVGVGNDNIAIWDTQSVQGIADAVGAIKVATERFMTNRAQGIKTTGVFSTGVDAVNKKTVTQSLNEIPSNEFALYPVLAKGRIDEFVRGLGYGYAKGMAYYQLTKTENIQAQKNVVVVEKSSGKAYGGDQARALIGLPASGTVRVKPDANPDYEIYVQSTSVNRNLMPNTRLLVLS